ncbi:MAG: DUF1730 domain-containing protein, partial [Rhodobiaceae bacterium]|nr:DUF1730 domain-containing protein [Rhodobiaceae bacterium]
MAPSPETLEARIKAKAAELGFDDVAIADTHADYSDRLTTFLSDGHHGTMGWMAEHADRRAGPRSLWPEAESAVVVACNYGPDRDPLAGLAEADNALVSVYAAGEDYHDVLKTRLKALARWFAAEAGAEVKVFVDTAPLMEKPLAARAGIGWQGK